MSHLIIDGYNLLAQSSYQSRDELLSELKKYQKKHAHKITIFFDGTHKGTGAGDSYFEDHIHVIFSPLTVTADDMIEEYLHKNQQSNIIVVSSDRRIQSAAKAKKLSYLEAKEFLFKIKFVSSTDKKVSSLPWLEGRTTEEVDRPTKKGGNPKKKSKKERQKRRTLNKV